MHHGRERVHLTIVVLTQVEKMRAELANLNHCAVPFLSRAAVNLSWYDSTVFYILMKPIPITCFSLSPKQRLLSYNHHKNNCRNNVAHTLFDN